MSPEERQLCYVFEWAAGRLPKAGEPPRKRRWIKTTAAKK